MNLRFSWSLIGGIVAGSALVLASMGLLAPGVTAQAIKTADSKAPPLDEVMEEVQFLNKNLIKYDRLTPQEFGDPEKSKEIVTTSEKMVQVTRWIEAHAPPAAAKKKLWQESVEGVRKGATEMVTAAKARDQSGYKTAVRRMGTSCTRCHDEFRP
jgi:cytochrome c556